VRPGAPAPIDGARSRPAVGRVECSAAARDAAMDPPAPGPEVANRRGRAASPADRDRSPSM